MSKKSQLKQIINRKIKPNDNEEISGEVLNAVLQETIDYIPDEEFLRTIVSGLIGAINPSTPIPERGWLNGSYLAETSGLYALQNNIEVDLKEGRTELNFDGAKWTKIVVPISVIPIVENVTAADNFEKGFRPGNSSFDKDTITEGKYFSDLIGSVEDNAATFVSDFIRILPDTEYVLPVYRRYIIFYNKNKVAISGSSDQSQLTVTAPSDAAYARIDGFLGAIGGFFLIQGTVTPIDTNFYPAENYAPIMEPIWKEIQVVRNASDFNSIKELADSLAPISNHYNRYRIIVPEGIFFECGWHGWGDFIQIVGASKSNTVVKLDGDSTNPNHKTPADFAFPTYANMQVDSVPNAYLDIAFVKENIHVDNLTFDVKSCKYAIHGDSENYQKAHFNNIIIKEANCNYPVGLGLWSGQHFTIENYEIIREHWHLKRLGVFMHNWNNQEKPCKLHLKNGKHTQCDLVKLDELGSGCADKVIIENVIYDGVGEIEIGVGQNGTKTFWINPATQTVSSVPTDVPYSLTIEAPGTKVGLISDAKYFPGTSYDGQEVRPNRLNFQNTDYTQIAFFSGVLEKGDLVCKIGDADNNNALRVQKFESMTASTPIVGVVDKIINASTCRIVPSGKVAETKVNSTTGNGVSRKLVFDSTSKTLKMEASANVRDVVAMAYETKNSPGVGVIKVKLL